MAGWLKAVAVQKCYCQFSWPNYPPVTFLFLSCVPVSPPSLPYVLPVTSSPHKPGCQSPLPLCLPSIISCTSLLECLIQVHCAATSPPSSLLLWRLADSSHRPCSGTIHRGKKSEDAYPMQVTAVFRQEILSWLPESSDCGCSHAAQDTFRHLGRFRINKY